MLVIRFKYTENTPHIDGHWEKQAGEGVSWLDSIYFREMLGGMRLIGML